MTRNRSMLPTVERGKDRQDRNLKKFRTIDRRIRRAVKRCIRGAGK